MTRTAGVLSGARVRVIIGALYLDGVCLLPRAPVPAASRATLSQVVGNEPGCRRPTSPTVAGTHPLSQVSSAVRQGPGCVLQHARSEQRSPQCLQGTQALCAPDLPPRSSDAEPLYQQFACECSTCDLLLRCCICRTPALLSWFATSARSRGTCDNLAAASQAYTRRTREGCAVRVLSCGPALRPCGAIACVRALDTLGGAWRPCSALLPTT